LSASFFRFNLSSISSLDMALLLLVSITQLQHSAPTLICCGENEPFHCLPPKAARQHQNGLM
jgi:hypothetical protein